MIILKLMMTHARHDSMRFVTAVFGVAAATALVVWSLGLTRTAISQSRESVRRMTEPFTCWVSTTGAGVSLRRGAPPPPGIQRGGAARPLPGDLVAAVAALPEIEQLLTCHVIRATLDYRPDGRVMQGPPLVADLTLAPAAGCPYARATFTGAWPAPESDEPLVAVCSSVFTPRRLAPPPLGSPLVLITPSGTVKVRIGALIDFPKTVRGFPTVFATRGVMRLAAGGTFDPSPTLLLCRTGEGAAARVLAAAKTAAAGAPQITAMARREVEAQVASDSLQNFKRQAPLLLTLSVFTALCMLVNALTVGVEQKLRVLALLRAAGMTARQVLRAVLLEGAVIAAGGWAAGLLGGWAVLTVFVNRTPDAFPEGVVLGWQTPLYSAAGVALIAALSLFWPCRRALRIRPLDVLAEHDIARDGNRNTGRLHAFRPWAGVVLLFPMLLLALPLHLSAMTRSVLLLTVGIPLHLVGLVLVLPAFIRMVERLSGPLLAALFGLDPVLLHRRISRHLSWTAGMVLTLTVGLGAYAAIHIWGASLTRPFIPSREFPDVIVSILPNGVRGDAAGQVARLQGVAANTCLAIEAAQFAVPDALTARVARVSGRVPASPNVLLFGADPQAAFGGARPLAAFRFLAGERQAAADALETGEACLITAMFARETGLGAGDRLEIQTRGPAGRGRGRGRRTAAARARESAVPESEGPSVAGFRIAGVVDLNWHLVTSRAQMRGRDGMPGGTMGPVFVSEAASRRLSGNADTTRFLWLNLSDAYRAKGPLPAGQALEAEIRGALAIDDANTVRVHHRDEIADGTIAHGTQLVGDMARAPFWSLVVLSTGIITLLLASFQASSKEIAVMRAVGMTRGQLGLILLGEALMAGLCGIVLSLVTGFCIGWTFTGWTRAWMPFGGLPVSLDIPWLVILQGVGFACALCVVMAALPILCLVRRDADTRL